MTTDRPTLAATDAGATPAARSYARSYARVADSSSSFLEEGATATTVPRRWTADETRVRTAAAPPFRFPGPDEAPLDELVRGYEHITGDPVRRAPKRNLVATCYRVHGDEFLPLVQRLFVANGTATNLLGEIRCLWPSPGQRDEIEPPEVSAPAAQHPIDPAPGLIYPADDRPPFDPTSTRRYDRHASNPDAAAFFTDEELGAGPARSPTDAAMSR